MNIKHELQSFFKDFMTDLEGEISKSSPYEAFLDEYLKYFEFPSSPIYVEFYRPNLNVHVDAYSYDEDNNELYLFILELDEFLEIPEDITMTTLKEIANKAKRFFVQYNGITVDPSHPVNDLVSLLKDEANNIERLNIIVVTNKYYRTNKPIELTIKNVPTDVEIWDIDRLFQLISSQEETSTIVINFKEEFDQSFSLMKVPQLISTSECTQDQKSFDCYIGFIPAKLLAKAYDKWGPKLVERNVRSFLQARGATNKGIRDTLKDEEEKELFVVYNNGISSVARTGSLINSTKESNVFNIDSLQGWQIVNGGQTTASIHKAYKDGINLDEVYVQTKLTILHTSDTESSMLAEEEMVSKISKYANTQNKINQSDLLANTRFMSSLEHHSRTVWIPSQDNRKAESKWYFERARGQYMVDLNRRNRGKEQTDFKKEFPKDLLLNKVDLAKNFMSWEGYPHVSSKGGEEAFKKFMDQNKVFWQYKKNGSNELEELVEFTAQMYKHNIARVIINRKVQNVVNTMGLKGYKANVVYYSTSMLNQLHGESINLDEVWNKQNLSDKWDVVIREIAQKTLEFLRDSAGEQNVTQWAKKEQCWKQYVTECKQQLKYIY
ncbi:AIPR family protein [Rossellomorea marisflavi]|uniref:AIPR family protein n=1 Tax=Rossellomorea marisflavi TaxID=189381 RepID=UPI00345775AC